MIDDHSRLGYSAILADEKRRSGLSFLFGALRFFRAHGVRVHRVTTDNRSPAGHRSDPRSGRGQQAAKGNQLGL